MCDTDQQAPLAVPPVVCQLHEAYYRQLVRLAALLTGDPDAAEEIAAAALAAPPPSLALASESVARYLHRQVLVRCRRIRPRQCGGQPGFAQLPVVRALQLLPLHGREAVVLTHYLELTCQQAAVVAGVSQAVLRKRLGRAMEMLQDCLPQA